MIKGQIKVTTKAHTYTGQVKPFFDEYKIDLRKDGRKCLLPETADCAWPSFKRALEVLVAEIGTKLSYEKEDA